MPSRSPFARQSSTSRRRTGRISSPCGRARDRACDGASAARARRRTAGTPFAERRTAPSRFVLCSPKVIAHGTRSARVRPRREHDGAFRVAVALRLGRHDRLHLHAPRASRAEREAVGLDGERQRPPLPRARSAPCRESLSVRVETLRDDHLGRRLPADVVGAAERERARRRRELRRGRGPEVEQSRALRRGRRVGETPGRVRRAGCAARRASSDGRACASSAAAPPTTAAAALEPLTVP